MPQTSPMNWLLESNWFMLSFTMMMTKSFFYTSSVNKKNNLYQKKLKLWAF